MKLLLLLLCLSSPAFGTDLLMVGWDGADYRRVVQLEDAGELPNLKSLGHLRELRIEENTFTKPSWAMELSGIPWPQTHVLSNEQFTILPRGATIFEELKSHGYTSIYVSGKCLPGNFGNMCIAGNNPLGRVKGATVYSRASRAFTPQQITASCKEGLALNPKFAFCHYQWPDFTGHIKGGGSSEYDESLRQNDTELGQILGLSDHVIVVSDHGFEMLDEMQSRFAPPRSIPFGFTHEWEPHAIIASDLPLRQGTGRDVFKTLCDVLGIECSDRTDGESLLQ